MYALNNPKRVAPYHVLLIAIVRIVSLYANNVTQVSFASTLRSYIFYTLFSLLCVGVIFLFARNVQRSAIITSYGLILMFSLIPLQDFFIKSDFNYLARLRYLIPAFGLIFFLGFGWLTTKAYNENHVTQMLNIFALLMLLPGLFQVFYYSNASTGIYRDSTDSMPDLSTSSTKFSPDIYWIVLDTHGRSDEILREFGYDNSGYIKELEQMGFYIAQCSNANYPNATWQSIYSALNMNYFDHDALRVQNPTQTVAQGFYGIKNNLVLSLLKENSYTYVNFNTTYDFLNFTDADYYYDLVYFPGTTIPSFNKFESMLLNQTALGLLIDRKSSENRIHYENIKSVLSKIPHVPRDTPSPKFVYVHLMIPHFPYVFSPGGGYISDGNNEFTPQKFTGQVKFIDREIVEVAQRLIANSAHQPVIIIQGDHGYSSPGILNAYYFPGKKSSDIFYSTLSPVNSFRLVFNSYFGADFDLLSDKIYIDNLGSDREHREQDIPYDFTEFAGNDECGK